MAFNQLSEILAEQFLMSDVGGKRTGYYIVGYSRLDTTRREGASLLFSPIRPRPTHHYQCDVI